MRNFSSDSIDLILTDPPYGINYKDGIKESRYWAKDGGRQESFDVLKNDCGNLDMGLIFKEFYRILKPKKMAYICCREDVLLNWASAIKDSGLKFNHSLIWRKGDMGYGNLAVMGTVHEIVVGLSKGNPEPSQAVSINGELKKRVPAEFCCKLSKEEYRGHPTQKPLGLMKYIIENRTKENDIVLDPFAGSGTTLIAADFLKRQYIGIEIDSNYYDLIVKRMKDPFEAMKDKAILAKGFSWKEIKGVTL